MRTFVFLLLFAMHARAGVCRGDTPCRACRTCKVCAYCTSGKGSCSVAREQADRESEARRKARAAAAQPKL